MQFAGIFRYEFNYQLRHVSTWLLFAIFLLFGFSMLRLVTLDDGTYLNAASTIAFFTVFSNIIWIVIGGVVAGDAATRDVQTRIHPLMYAAPVSKFNYLGARFLAASALNALIMIILNVGILISLYGPGARTEFIGPFSLASFITSYCFIALPCVLVTTAIQFAFAALSGRAFASYIASFGILVFSQLAGTTVTYALQWRVIGALMDLLGTGITEDMESWTPIEKNTRLILLEGLWLWNRIVWLSIATGFLAYTYFRFQLGYATNTSIWITLFRKKDSVQKVAQSNVQDNVAPKATLPNPKFDKRTLITQIFAITQNSFSIIAKSRTGLTIIALFSIGTGLFATEYMEFLGVPLLARTQEVLRILTPPLNSFKTHWVIIPLLIVFFSGDLVWRERDAGLNELSDTTSTPEWVMFLGKFLGLAGIVAVWMLFLIIGGIINQLVMGYHQFELLVYIKALFGIQLTNYLLFALLMLVVHVIVNQKYVGYIVALGAYGFILFATKLGIEHKMLMYASDTGWNYSDMRGLQPFVKPLIAFRFYWAAWAFFIAILATLLWVRNKESAFRTRFALAKSRLKKYKESFVLSSALLLVSGGYIFYNTNILNEYVPTSVRKQTRAEYEKRYSKYENITQPDLTATSLAVDIFPDDMTARVTGSYTLVNRSTGKIDSIHLSTIPDLPLTISLDGKASMIDDKNGYRVYALNKPLYPGDSIPLHFAFEVNQSGFGNDGVDLSVVGNGSHITNDWMPVIGYDENRQLREMNDRKKYKLMSRPVRPSLYDGSARYKVRHAQKMNFSAVVSTCEDQTAVAPGKLIKSWTKGNRKYFKYATNAAIHNDYAIFSARYKVRRAEWKPAERSLPVSIEVYHHPTHDGTIDRMMRSAKLSLEYYSKEFGSYPYDCFRVLERPGAARGMHADPVTIDFQEGYSLMNPEENGLDLPYHIMSHEVAHQWWGLRLAPAAVEGAGLLVESLATYSAMQVVEETLGYNHLLKYLAQTRLEYEVPRSRAAPPLLQSNNSFMNYRKGPFALFALRNYVGKEPINDALRKLLSKPLSDPPLQTSLDLYNHLKSVSPDSVHQLIHDLFAANTFWELKATQATARQNVDSTWQVGLHVETRKVVVDSVGIETVIPMNDWIEIGVYGRSEDGTKTKTLYLQKHLITSAKDTIRINVPEEPARAGIDPNHLLIDFEMDDNIRKVKIDQGKLH